MPTNAELLKRIEELEARVKTLETPKPELYSDPVDKTGEVAAESPVTPVKAMVGALASIQLVRSVDVYGSLSKLFNLMKWFF
jgi:hypothetical protein